MGQKKKAKKIETKKPGKKFYVFDLTRGEVFEHETAKAALKDVDDIIEANSLDEEPTEDEIVVIEGARRTVHYETKIHADGFEDE